MGEEELRIHISSTLEGEKVDLTISELGALLTGLHRSFNKLINSRYYDSPEFSRYFPIVEEPGFVQLRIRSVQTGSIDIHGILEALRPALEHGMNVADAVLGAAIYDAVNGKILIRDFKRAVQRVARGSPGKEIKVRMYSSKGAITGFLARIGHDGKVREVRVIPSDDVQ